MPDSMAELTDREIIEEVLAGNKVAYRALVERYQGRIYEVVYAMVRNREDARDLTQDVFIKAFKDLAELDLDSDFYSFVYNIAMNVANDHLRRHKEKIEHTHEDLRDRIIAALTKLSAGQREVIQLREIDGLTYIEIAELLEIPEGTVMSRLYRGRKKLKAVLRKD